MSGISILENLVSDFAFLLIALILGWLVFYFSRRNKKLRFFGIKEAKRIVLYVSNLRVKPFGAIGIDNVARSYKGQTVAHGEMLSANIFRDFFNYLVPSLADQPSLISKLLISDVIVDVSISPVRESQLEYQVPFIALGSPAFNVASKYLEEKSLSKVKFRFGAISKEKLENGGYENLPTAYSHSSELRHTGDTGISGSYPGTLSYEHLAGDSGGTPFEYNSESEGLKSAILIEDLEPITQTTYGFVERVLDLDMNRMLFYIAGLSELSTTGAAHYLSSQWEYLEMKYENNRPFLVMLKFESTDYKKWKIVFEK